ncbi:MAG: BACON domain-containing protein [Bacteroidales bacterium]|nr:BACON domain-containing protein [Bacteroidales bacterium]
MKAKYLIPLFAAAVLSVVSCNEKENKKEALGVTLDKTELSFDQAAGSKTIKLSANTDWTVASEIPSWLTVNPSKAGSGKDVTISVTANAGIPRRASITFTDGSLFPASLIVNQDGPVDGSFEHPLTPSQAREYVQYFLGDGETAGLFFINGKIHKIKEGFAANKYGNATFYISETGEASETDFQIFQTNYLGNRPATKEDTDVKVGDEVVVLATITNFGGNTPETVSSSKGINFIYSINGVNDGGLPTGDGSLEKPFNPIGALAFLYAQKTLPSSENVAIQGIVSKITNPFSEEHGTSTFYISEKGTSNETEFQCYGAYFLDNANWKDGNTQIKVGDEVIVFGKVDIYTNNYGSTPETADKQAYIYSLNGKTGAEAPAPFIRASEFKQTETGVSVKWVVKNVKDESGLTFTSSLYAGEVDPSKLVTSWNGGEKDAESGLYASAKEIELAPKTKYYLVVSFNLDAVTYSSEPVSLTASAPGEIAVTMEKEALAAAPAGGATVNMDDVISFVNESSYTGTVTELRIYKNKKFTVSAKTGYKITGITFICTASGDKQYGPGSFGTGAPEGYSVDGTQGEWIGSADKVEFTAASNQVRAEKLTVTYVKQ